MAAREHGARLPAPRTAVVAMVAAGGVVGALARYGSGLALPTAPGAFPFTTFGVNVLGCLLMGVLVAALAGRPGAHPLWRPFLGTGVLGGFTTFSTYAVDADGLLGGTAPQLSLGVVYLVATAVAAIGAAAIGAALGARLVRA